jgi:hypothetical protein
MAAVNWPGNWGGACVVGWAFDRSNDGEGLATMERVNGYSAAAISLGGWGAPLATSC